MTSDHSRDTRSSRSSISLLGYGEEDARRADILLALLKVIAGIALLPLISALLNPVNSTIVTVVFYGTLYLGIYGLARLARGGYVMGAAWGISIFIWAMIAFVTLYFGGIRGGYAASFVIPVVIVGGVVGGRAPLALALVSCAWCGVLVWLETRGMLPQTLAQYSAFNSWSGISVMLILSALMLGRSLESLRRMHQRSEEIARERDEALRRSIQSQKMEVVGSLASGVAHDFNNLLAVISGSVALLRLELPKDTSAEVRGLLDDTDAATTRAALMTRQLLSFGRAPLAELAPVDLVEVLEAFGPMVPRLIGPRITVQLDTGERAIVKASRVGLEQILLNLIVNAREAMDGDGRLVIKVRVVGEKVELGVRDSGVGMDAETLSRIFEPFFTTKRTGTGLGLATVRDIVTRFGGTVSAESVVGEGTTFFVRIPVCHDIPPDRRAAVAPPIVDKEVRRILLVEDDLLVRRALTLLLERSGFDVVAVADGEEALAIAPSLGKVDCVVSDLAMPRVGGVELAERLSLSMPELPFVLLSGDRAPPASVLSSPRRAFLEKPFEHAALLRAIDTVTSVH